LDLSEHWFLILILSAAKSNDFKELMEEIAGIITQKFGKTTA
jgi:hypothetical protein